MNLSSKLSPFARQLFCTVSVQRLETINYHFIRFSSQYKTATNNIPQSEYRYTLPNRNLSDEQRQFYEKNGFIVIRKLVNPKALDHFRKRFREICEGKVKDRNLVIMKDVAIHKSESAVGEQAVTKVQDFTSDEELFKYCCLPEIIHHVENFTGPNIIAMNAMIINKPPDPGTQSSRQPFHQDLHFFPFRPANRIVCAWTAMEKVNRQNGGLVILPGTHQGKLEEHEYPDWEGGVNKMYHGVKNLDRNREKVYLDMDTGDTIFFHPLLIHGSGTNRSSGFRKAISCHFADSACEYIECDNTTQESISKEWEAVFQKRSGIPNASFQDMWRAKSRLVQGERINM